MDPFIVSGLVLAGCAVGALTLAGVRRVATRSDVPRAQLAAPPAEPEALRVHPEVAAAIADLAIVRAEWATYRKEMEKYLEAFLDVEETIERKRRRTAARESRANGAADAAPAPPDLRAQARAMGIPV